MSLENITASYANGKATVSGKKPAGQGTVTLYVGTSTTPAGPLTTSDTDWKIGPFDLAPGTYTIKVTFSTGTNTNGKSIYFDLTVPAPPPPGLMVDGITYNEPHSPVVTP